MYRSIATANITAVRKQMVSDWDGHAILNGRASEPLSDVM
jgi:hypothetical protein